MPPAASGGRVRYAHHTSSRTWADDALRASRHLRSDNGCHLDSRHGGLEKSSEPLPPTGVVGQERTWAEASPGDVARLP